jgi:hypothetical protein
MLVAAASRSTRGGDVKALVVLVAVAWRTRRGRGLEALVVLVAETAMWKTRRGRGYSPVVSRSLRTVDPPAAPILTP